MKYSNPIIPGMYPDPSVCKNDGSYYIVNSSFEYFPGVPIFESKDLVNWKKIGHCLTRKSQFDLDDSPCSGGIFAPTLRYYNSRYYMITTCFGTNGLKIFYVYTDEIHKEWSEPVYVNIKGIDPSLFWEEGKTYIQYAEFGEIFQVEIELESGKIIEGPVKITDGCGGRDVEGPHMWKKDAFYYLMLAEGGTREGHMVTLMRGKSVWGPFEASPYNPVISNKDFGKQPIQCVGHADLVDDESGNSYLVTLGTRHVKHRTLLGRETMLTPAYWTEDGWLRSGYGYMPMECEVDINTEQIKNSSFNFNMSVEKLPYELISPRQDNKDNYRFENNSFIIRGNGYTLNDGKGALWGLRQTEFDFEIKVNIEYNSDNKESEAGVVMLVNNDHHISLFITKRNGQKSLVLRKTVADIVAEKVVQIENKDTAIELIIKGNKEKYEFYYENSKKNIELLDWSYTKHLSIECAGSPNTGVVVGVYVVGDNEAIINKFSYNTVIESMQGDTR